MPFDDKGFYIETTKEFDKKIIVTKDYYTEKDITTNINLKEAEINALNLIIDTRNSEIVEYKKLLEEIKKVNAEK
jgi:NAD(P)H-nitrite reductase large subunit